jgi:hypothetical protein
MISTGYMAVFGRCGSQENDPELGLAQNASLKTALARRAAGRVDLSKVG